MYQLEPQSRDTRSRILDRSGARREIEASFVRPSQPAPTLYVDFPVILGWLTRFWWVVVTVTVLGAVLGLGASMIIKPRYTAYSDMVVDPSNLQVVSDDLFATSQQSDAQVLGVESKMRVLTSGNVLRRVVETLGLDKDPEFGGPEFPVLNFLPSGGAVDSDPVIGAMRTLSERIRARREERSFVVTVSAWDRTPEKAALVTDAVVAAFREELAQGEADSAAQAAASLNERLGELKHDVAVAEDAVEAFKRANGLQTTGTELLSAQSVAQINTQVLSAQQAMIAAQSRYDQLTGSSGEAKLSAAAQNSATISALRTQYATLKQQADSLSVRLGPKHPNLVTVQSQMAGLQGEIDREIARIVQTTRSELDQAKAVFEALSAQSQAVKSDAFSDGEAQVQLRELEREASSKASIYESFLTRAKEITERRGLDTTNVRIISTAVPPLSRSYPPRTVLLVGGGAFGGLFAGLALAGMIGLGGALLLRRRR